MIDDLSDDETNEVYGNYHDKRLKYFRNYENLGMGLNRQKAYNLSNGDYIIFVMMTIISLTIIIFLIWWTYLKMMTLM